MHGTILRTGPTCKKKKIAIMSLTHTGENGKVNSVKAVTKYNITPSVQNFIITLLFYLDVYSQHWC